jgi:hypothetical protein
VVVWGETASVSVGVERYEGILLVNSLDIPALANWDEKSPTAPAGFKVISGGINPNLGSLYSFDPM